MRVHLFFEVGATAAHGLYDGAAPCAGVIAGIGQLQGHKVMVICNDATVKGGTYFLAGPPLVKAATGEIVSAEDLGGGEVHTRLSGVADYLAEHDTHALVLARGAVTSLNWDGSGMNHVVRALMAASHDDPLYDPAELLGIVPSDTRQPYDICTHPPACGMTA